MSTRKNAEFQSVGPSEAVRRRLSSVSADSKPTVVAGFTSLTVSKRSAVSIGIAGLLSIAQPMWAGIAGSAVPNEGGFEIAISIHDSVYNTDYASQIIPFPEGKTTIESDQIETHILDSLRQFSTEHLCKFLGAGVTLSLLKEVR